jgi:hypothetical protein
VTVSLEQRVALLKILTGIEDDNDAVPRVPGELGRFLHEFAMVHARVKELLAHEGPFVRGSEIGVIALTPLAPLQERMGSELMGEVASTIGISEQLGGLVDITLWGKARAANRLRNAWLAGAQSVSLTGSFRWFAPRRLTPGAADVAELEETLDVLDARCLKFAGDDFLSAPPAATYRWDTAHGPPDFRTFRVAALYKDADSWTLVPRDSERATTPMVVADAGSGVLSQLAPASLALAMLVRTPWESAWVPTVAKRADPETILAHLITWADHRRELELAPPPEYRELAQLRRALLALGHVADEDVAFSRANLRRRVAPSVQPLVRWIRGIG